MRSPTDSRKVLAFIEEIGRTAQGPGRIYIVGGATAVLLGIRNQTIDLDIKLDPEPKAIFESIAELKERLGLNIELASPDQFLPALPGWRERSEFIARKGQVEFYHYDFYGQALAKILRGHEKDVSDAKALASLGKVAPERLLDLFRQIRPDLIRFPAIDIADFEGRVAGFVEGLASDE